MAPRWLLEGIKLQGNGNKEDAQAVWSEGVMALPGYHRVWLLDSHVSEAAASAAFAEASGQYPVVLLTSKKAGRTQSHVFAYTDGEESQALANSLAQKLGAAPGRWVSAASLRLRLNGSAQDKSVPTDTGAVAVRKPEPKPASKPAAARRPSAQANVAAPVAESAPAMSLPAPSEAPSLLARAEKLVNANQAVEALFELRSAKGQELEDWRYHYLVGAAEMKLGRQVKAQEALSTAIRLNPRQPEARLKRAVLNQEQGLHNDAMADLREVEKIAPQLPEVYLNQGYSADALNRLGEARTAYLQFLNLSKSKANYGATRAWVTKRLGDLNTETR
jgi:tetratricopeptide (TPR) repeat protein